ncbi:MAG: metalloprotease TldD [Deltaproteobacteria bacterium]|nr:MAG: metalloprotease TldD [Deltaproteobacteria bacterium]
MSLDAIDHALALRVLSAALDRGGDYADLFLERRANRALGLDDGRLRDVRNTVDLGCGIRVLAGDATGYAYTEDLSAEALLRAARTAAAIAHGGQTVQPQDLTPVGLPDRYPVAQPGIDGDVLERLDFLRRADETARKADPRITRVNVSLVDSLREIRIFTSDGRTATDRQPMLRFSVSVVAEAAGQRQTGSDSGGGRRGLDYLDERTPEDMAREAVRVATLLLDAREAPAGTFPVVLAPGDSGILLHEAVGHGLEADFNRKKTSNYSDRIGERVAAPGCTIIDDARLPGSRGSINVDDEGEVPECHTLIEDGILRGYLQDRVSSQHFRTRAGSGRRQSFRHVPMPRMTNTAMLAGEHDPGEIIASVKLGVYARAFSGGQVNISNGDFVFSITEGYLIEDGRITHPLKGVNLIGNGPDAMTRVSMVGSDFKLSDGRWTCGKDGQSVPVGVGIPTVKIDEITVGGSQA